MKVRSLLFLIAFFAFHVTVVAQNKPVAKAKATPPTANDSDGNGSETITLSDDGSSVQGGSITKYEWKEGNAELGEGAEITYDFSVGSHNVDLIVTGSAGGKDTAGVIVTVKENQSPMANPGGDMTVTDIDRNSRESVTLNGEGSMDTDPNGSIVSYEWQLGAEVLGTTEVITHDFSVGKHNVKLIVTDNGNKKDSATVQVRVNQRPSVENPIDDITIILANPVVLLDLKSPSHVFIDADGDLLTYMAESSSDAVVSAGILADSLLVISPQATGTAEIIVIADDTVKAIHGSGKDTTVFMVTVDVNRPQVTMIQPTETETFSTTLQNTIVTATIISNDLPLKVSKLVYRVGGQANLDSVDMSRIATEPPTYEGRIPISSLTSRGLAFYIVAADSNRDSTVTEITSRGIQVESVSKQTAQPAGSDVSQYRLVSIPIDLTNKRPSAVFSNFGSYDKSRWRFYEPLADGPPNEFPNTENMAPGKAFWLLVKQEGMQIETGPGVSNLIDRRYGIPLTTGWNYIGNPFDFSIPLTNLCFESNTKPHETNFTLWTYNEMDWGKLESGAAIEPFEGYAVQPSSAGILYINPEPFMAPPPQESLPLWALRIKAKSRNAFDLVNLAGVHADAVIDLDKLDSPEPPIIGDYVSLYFPHPEWNTSSKEFAMDYRPEFTDVEAWEFEVKTNIPDKVELTFEGLRDVPQEYEVWLVDEALKISRNLREHNQYSVAGRGPENPKQLKLVVGKSDFISEYLEGTQSIPNTSELAQNFPNPFNPATTIRYSLPNTEQVTLKVYNLLGKEVATLVQSEEKAAGNHVAIWDGRTNRDSKVSSGVYIYRMQAGDFNFTRKMILLK